MNSHYTLQLQAAQGIGAAAQRAVLDFIHQHGLTLADYFKLRLPDQQAAGLSEQQAGAVMAPATVAAAQRWTDDLARNKIQVIHLYDPLYPERPKRVLGKLAPPILAVWGDLELLERPAVGWCGSRHASAQGIDFTKATVGQAVERKITVVSGAAKGVDTAAHHTALENGGTTIVVAPEGIVGFRLRAEIRQLVTSHNTLVISEFQPDARWSAANAMTRNHTLIGLSNALIVVESGLQGGAYEAGNFALKVNVPLFVAEYVEPSASAVGNSYFLQRGAMPVRVGQPEQRAGLQRLFGDILTHHDRLKPPPVPAVMQDMLFTTVVARR